MIQAVFSPSASMRADTHPIPFELCPAVPFRTGGTA